MKERIRHMLCVLTSLLISVSVVSSWSVSSYNITQEQTGKDVSYTLSAFQKDLFSPTYKQNENNITPKNLPNNPSGKTFFKINLFGTQTAELNINGIAKDYYIYSTQITVGLPISDILYPHHDFL